MKLELLNMQVQQALEAEHYSQYTHKPNIDAISERLARPKTDAELAANTRGSALRASLVKQREAELQQECTFKPTLGERSQALAARAPQR